MPLAQVDMGGTGKEIPRCIYGIDASVSFVSRRVGRRLISVTLLARGPCSWALYFGVGRRIENIMYAPLRFRRSTWGIVPYSRGAVFRLGP